MATVGDIVLVHYDRKPRSYARIEDIAPDVKRGWWEVTLLMLTVPTQTCRWILEDCQIDGDEFTMSGVPVRLELLPPASAPVPQAIEPAVESAPRVAAKVISLTDRVKK